MMPAAGGALSAAAEILCILASGYLIHENLLLRLAYREYSGHALYFRVLVVGLVWQEAFVHFGFSRAAGLVCAVGLYAGTSAALRAVFYFHNNWAIGFYRRYFSVSERLFDSHMLQAMSNHLNVAVTLESGKVYIGKAMSVRRHSDTKWLTLLPMSSGYRDDKQKLRITTDYFDALATGLLESREMLITLPTERIASLQFFDAGFHEYDNALDDYRDSDG